MYIDVHILYIAFKLNSEKILFNCDKEQMGRVFFNLIKNSIESIEQKTEKDPNFEKKIAIEILNNNEHIKFILIDNGLGFNKETNNFFILNNLGNVLLDVNEYQKTIEVINKALNIRPDFAEAYNTLGLALYKGGDIEGSIFNFKKAIELK